MVSHLDKDPDMIFFQATIVEVRVMILHHTNTVVLQTGANQVNNMIKVSTYRKLGDAGIAKDILLPTCLSCLIEEGVGVGAGAGAEALHVEERVAFWAKGVYQYFRIGTVKLLSREEDISICQDREDTHRMVSKQSLGQKGTTGPQMENLAISQMREEWARIPFLEYLAIQKHFIEDLCVSLLKV